jgi:hypothetical protein
VVLYEHLANRALCAIWPSPNRPHQIYHNLVKIYSLFLPKCKTINSLLPKNSSKYFDYPLQHCGVEVFPCQDHEEDVKLKAKPDVEEKTWSRRPNQKLKRRQGVEDQKKRNQEDDSVKPPDLEFIQLLKPSLCFPLKLFLLSVWHFLNKVRKPPINH